MNEDLKRKRAMRISDEHSGQFKQQMQRLWGGNIPVVCKEGPCEWNQVNKGYDKIWGQRDILECVQSHKSLLRFHFHCE